MTPEKTQEFDHDFFDDDFPDEWDELWSLHNRVMSIIGNLSEPWHSYTEEVLEDIKLMKANLAKALDLLNDYDYATTEDEKYDIGFEFSTVYADILEDVNYLQETSKVCLYLH